MSTIIVKLLRGGRQASTEPVTQALRRWRAAPFLGEHRVKRTAFPHTVDLQVLDQEALLSHAYLL